MAVVAVCSGFSDAEDSMGSVSPKVDEGPLPEGGAVEDEEDMTSIMSAEQRKALQQAAKTEKESATLERETAKPPPSDARPMTIPRAAPVPAEARAIPETKAEAPAKPEAAAKSVPAPAKAAKAAEQDGFATWELVAFALLAAAIFVALRM